MLELLHSGLRLAGNCFKKGSSTQPSSCFFSLQGMLDWAFALLPVATFLSRWTYDRPSIKTRRHLDYIRNGFLHWVVPRDRDVFSVTYNREKRACASLLKIRMTGRFIALLSLSFRKLSNDIRYYYLFLCLGRLKTGLVRLHSIGWFSSSSIFGLKHSFFPQKKRIDLNLLKALWFKVGLGFGSITEIA